MTILLDSPRTSLESKDFGRVNSGESEQLISAEVCDDPVEINGIAAAAECQRCGSDERIAAMVRFPDFPDQGFLAICGHCYRELTKCAGGRVV
jgi:hypothetical protein